MVGLVKTALLAVDDGPDARANAIAILDGWVAGTRPPARVDDAWATPCYSPISLRITGCTQYCGPLLAELEPFGDRIAVIGQVGIAGPVALATCAAARAGR